MTEYAGGGFPARVAVLASAAAELLASKNNLSCADLFQPFCNVAAEGQVRDPSGAQYIVKNFKLAFSNVNARPPQPTLARKFLNESVSKNYSDKTIVKTIGKFQLEIPASTPWFDAWRETFFQVQFPSDHEFTKHFVSCLLIASSSEANPLESVSHMSQQLSQMQNVAPPKLPKWFNSNVLRCYVLLHDSSEGNVDKTKRYFESLKQSYGAGNCFLLTINSRNPHENDNCVLPDPWSKYLIRRIEVNDSGSDKDSLPRTPADMTSVSNMPINVEVEIGTKDETSSSGYGDDSSITCESATEASESGAVTVHIHPLSPSEENDSVAHFDSNESIHIDVMTNSTGNEISIMNSNVWEQSTIGVANGVHGACLSTQDIENIKNFVQDFALKALLPYFERQIFQLQDAVANKKGVSRSILNATKRWFGTNKPGSNMPVNTVIYTGDCAELQLRRLGDIWYMLGQWNLAFQAYHTAKREYNADGAWLCYAGALEMAALSAFMANESSRKTYEYMEESISKYLVACRMPQYAVRATLLSVQCLFNRGLYSDAARQLIRMTSEDCDLRSAVLLEQAALCFLAEPSKKALPRKYAFHMVLAGHRYSKAGQRKHSLRCYKQAYQIYQGSGWRLATDHIEFAVGRLAGQVRDWEASAGALSSLLAPRSLQPPAQQAAFLREYLHILNQSIPNETVISELPQLPLPILQSDLTVVHCGNNIPISTPGRVVATGTDLTAPQTAEKTWINLEKMLVHKARGPQMIFKPTISLYSNTTDNSSSPISPQNELIQLLVHFHNPLQVDVTISDVQLLWQFKSETSNQTSDFFTNESCIIASSELDKSIMTTQKVPILHLSSDKTTPVILNLTPLHPGELNIVGVAYKLVNPLQTNEENINNGLFALGKQVFKIRGRRLKNTKESVGECYDVDKRLTITIVPPSPCLQVTFSEISNQLLCGELQRMSVEFRNVGRVPLKSLYMSTSHPQYISLSVENEKDRHPFSLLIETMYTKPSPLSDERKLLAEREERARNRHCIKILDFLDSDQSYTTILWLHAPEQMGNHLLHALFYYESSQTNSHLKHRLLRHSWNITLKDSVHIAVLPRRTLRLNKEEVKYREALNLAIEVKNTNQIHHGILTSLEVQQVSLLSKSWKLSNYVPICQDAKILSSQETLHLIMCAQRDIIQNNDIDLLYSDLNFKSNDNSNILSIKERPYSYFITGYCSTFDENDSNEVVNKMDDSDIDNESIHSTVVFRWKADITINGGAQRIAVGQHRLVLERLNLKVSSVTNSEIFKPVDNPSMKLFGANSTIPGSSIYPSLNMPVNERLVTFCLEHQLQVSHNFKSQHICLVPVKIHLVNCSLKNVIAILNTCSSKSSDECSGISWVGLGGNESGGVQTTLPSLESQIVGLQIACTSPGTYLLGNIIRVLCKVQQDMNYSDPILQNHMTTSTLIVTQCS